MLCCSKQKNKESKSVRVGSLLYAVDDLKAQTYTVADLSWLDYANCYRCATCGSVVALGHAVCPSCGGGLKGLTVAEPPPPRNAQSEPDNGFQCYECGLMWKKEEPDGCPACGGLLYPILVDETLLG